MIRQGLLAWYGINKRDLPWRKTSNLYRILVSELMLQQTQVATVIPYYKRFLKLFPTAQKLAVAPEQAVLKAWEGLGYYRRARFLHRAAKVIAVKGFPKDRETLRELPGVGEYTAAAVSSIALGLPEAVMDGNVVRVLTRLFALGGDPAVAPLKVELHERAQALLDRRQPGDFNQAVMELGALLCTPTAPDCCRCPVEKFCISRKSGREMDYPQLAPRPVTQKVFKVFALIFNGQKVLMAERTGTGRSGDKGRMHGLWQFPERVLRSEQKAEHAALDLAGKVTHGKFIWVKELESVVHHVTNHKITVKAFVFESSHSALDWQWVSFQKLKTLPLAKAERLVLKRLQE